MSKTYLSLLAVFIYLFTWESYQNSLELRTYYPRQKTYFKPILKQVSTTIAKEPAAIIHAMVTGNKRRIPKKKLKQFKLLGLMHILTPSGLHLSWLMLPRVYLPALLYLLILSAISLIIFGVPHFYPIKRILIFKWLHKLIPALNIKSIFALTFLIDLLIGHYSKSPYSSLLSFLFWGTIITHERLIDISLFKKLFINLLIVSLLWNESANLLSYFYNPVISFFISITFPFIAISFFLAPIFDTPILISASFIESICKTMEWINHEAFIIKIDIFALAMTLCIFLGRPRLLLILAIINCGSLNYKMDFKIRGGKWIKPPQMVWRP